MGGGLGRRYHSRVADTRTELIKYVPMLSKAIQSLMMYSSLLCAPAFEVEVG